MGSRHAADEDGRQLAAGIRGRIGAEIRQARRAAGVSQDAAAVDAGMSRPQYGRIERGEIIGVTLVQACRAASAVGLRLGLTVFAEGDAVRDAGQLRLLERFRGHLPQGAAWRTEVPLPIAGDRRAWDATVGLLGRRAGCEAETRVRDVQAVERKLALKLRDGQVDIVILILADTASNRAALARHREELRGLLPLDTREVLRCLRGGRLPGASGLVIL